MKLVKALILCSMGLLTLSGCAYAPLLEETELPTDYTYQIGPGDSVQIFVWGYPEISTEATVRPDGKISTPLVDDVVAVGKTPVELADEMEGILSEFVRDPQVAIIVGNFQGVFDQQVRVIQTGGGGGFGGGGGGFGGGGGGFGGGGGGGGITGSARAFPYRTGMTLLDLMIEVGGLSSFSDGNRAMLIRKIDGDLKPFSVRIDDLLSDGDLRANVNIMPGDILIIPEAFF